MVLLRHPSLCWDIASSRLAFRHDLFFRNTIHSLPRIGRNDAHTGPQVLHGHLGAPKETDEHHARAGQHLRPSIDGQQPHTEPLCHPAYLRTGFRLEITLLT